MEGTELHMLVSHVAIERQSVVGRDQCAATVWTLRYSATTQMENGTGSRSELQLHTNSFCRHLHTNPIRQFGSMTEKVADYEKILRDLTTRVSDEDASLIRNTLERVCVEFVG